MTTKVLASVDNAQADFLDATDLPSGTPITDTFTGDGAQTTFTLSQTATGTWGIAAVNGAQLLPSEFAIAGTSVVFDVAPAVAAEVTVTYVWGGGLSGGLSADIIASLEAADPALSGANPVATTGALLFSAAVLDFQETAGAGTYTAAVAILEHGMIWQVAAVARATGWDADTALLDIGDQDDSEQYTNGLNLKSEVNVAFDPIALEPMVTMLSNQADLGGNYYRASPFPDARFVLGAVSGSTIVPPPNQYDGAEVRLTNQAVEFRPGVFYDAGGTITAVLTTTGAGGATGHVQVLVYGFGLQAGFVSAVKT